MGYCKKKILTKSSSSGNNTRKRKTMLKEWKLGRTIEKTMTRSASYVGNRKIIQTLIVVSNRPQRECWVERNGEEHEQVLKSCEELHLRHNDDAGVVDASFSKANTMRIRQSRVRVWMPQACKLGVCNPFMPFLAMIFPSASRDASRSDLPAAAMSDNRTGKVKRQPTILSS